MSALRCRQGGLAAVEMAIVAPLFVLLMMATAELGRAFYSYNVLTKSVREGARYLSAGALNGAEVIELTDAKIAAAKNLVAYGTPAAGTSLLKDLTPANVAVATVGGTQVSVTVTYPYQPLFAAIPSFGYGSKDITVGTLTAVSVMRAM